MQRLCLGLAVPLFAAALVWVILVLRSGVSPLGAAVALYSATVAYGLAEMAKLRERHLFRPNADAPRRSPLRWWAPRIVLVVVVATMPAVLLLGGLTRR